MRLYATCPNRQTSAEAARQVIKEWFGPQQHYWGWIMEAIPSGMTHGIITEWTLVIEAKAGHSCTTPKGSENAEEVSFYG